MASKGKMHFTGVAGNGMSALCQLALAEGWEVTGSDRDFDKGRNPSVKAALEKLGVKIFPQDASGVDKATAALVVSTAVEDSNPEVAKARELGARVLHRSELLADYVSRHDTVAVGGTSGKSTVVAMIFEILYRAGRDPGVITGGPLVFLREQGLLGNGRLGRGPMVVETDESDGTITRYKPKTGILLNISKDHKEIPELKKIFAEFAANCGKFYVNSGDPECAGIRADAVPFGPGDRDLVLSGAELGRFDSSFLLNGVRFRLPLPGDYNVENAAAAVKVCLGYGLSLEECASALASFRGVSRRFEIVGEAGGVTVVDDFAHNPAKVAAVLKAARRGAKRVIAVFQPHGFTPARHMRKELAAAFADGLRAEDLLIMPEIFYIGGTVTRNISSADLVADAAALGRRALFIEKRSEIPGRIAELAAPGDLVLVMGARDATLSDFARDVFSAVAGVNSR